MHNQLRWTKSIGLSIGACILILGCAKNPEPPRIDPATLKIPDYEDLVPGGPTDLNLPGSNIGNPLQAPPSTGQFLQTMNRLSIRLTDQEIQELRTLIKTTPSDAWAPSSTRTAEENLEANFSRFGNLFQPAPDSAVEYRKQAKTFAEKITVPFYLDLQYYINTKAFLIAKWDKNSKEFVVIRPDGSLVNYLTSSAISFPRYIEIDL